MVGTGWKIGARVGRGRELGERWSANAEADKIRSGGWDGSLSLALAEAPEQLCETSARGPLLPRRFACSISQNCSSEPNAASTLTGGKTDPGHLWVL